MFFQSSGHEGDVLSWVNAQVCGYEDRESRAALSRKAPQYTLYILKMYLGKGWSYMYLSVNKHAFHSWDVYLLKAPFYPLEDPFTVYADLQVFFHT